MPPAIRIENLSKRYQIGVKPGHDETMLREVLAHAVTAPFRRMKERLTAMRTNVGNPNSLSNNGHTPNQPSSHPPASEFWALRDVNFEIQAGEVVGIIGRNGAGKSTLLKILSRIVEPTAGRVEVRGRMASLLEVGTGFHPELTGRENIFLNGAILGMTRREIIRQFDEIVDFSGIERFIDTPVKRYSSGMYVRLAFAVAAHLQPEVLVVDEVLAVGDSEFQQKCIGKIHDVASQGRTVLFVTHNMPIMLKLCTNAVMLEHGCVTGHGCVQSIVHQYLTNRWRPQSSISDLSQLKRPIDCLRRAQLRTCRLTATGDDEPWSLPYGAAIEFEVTVRVECHLPSLELGIAISNSTGVEIASLLSTDALERVAVAPGVHEFRVHVSTLRLTPGSYRIGFGLRAGRGMEDYLPEAVHFEVQHTPDSARLNVQSRRGAVVPDFECSLAAVISPDPAF